MVPDRDGPCPSCGAKVGELHGGGCGVEQCPLCGDRRNSCPCPKAEAPGGDRLAWTGELPGAVECGEFGWHKEGTAEPDLGRLKEARWDPGLKRWEQRWDLSIELSSFIVAAGLGWDMPDDSRVHLCVGWTVSMQGNDARCDRLNEDFDLAGYRPTPADQYLAVRAGDWEFHPRVRFHGVCANYPGAYFRLGDLRRFWKEAVGEQFAVSAIGGEECVRHMSKEPVRVRVCDPWRLVLEFFGVRTN